MDVLAWDLPANSPEGGLKLQFAANVYMQVPRSGGELVVWPVSLDREKYLELNTGSYGVDASKLGVEPTIITPKVGELILFNCRLVHAVNDNDECDRVAASCFVGYRGHSLPLPMWS